VGHVACMEQIRNAYKILVVNHARPRRTKMGREIGCECVDWMHLAQDKDELQTLVNTVEHLGSIKGQ